LAAVARRPSDPVEISQGYIGKAANIRVRLIVWMVQPDHEPFKIPL
jgi:hypothetical protein